MGAKTTTAGCRRALRRVATLVATLAATSLFALSGSTSALASSGVWWHASSRNYPTQMAPGSTGTIVVAAVNRGYQSAEGAGNPVTITDKLPPGLKATAVQGAAGYLSWTSTNGVPVECTLTPLRCTFKSSLLPYQRIWITIAVEVSPVASESEVNEANVSGGGGSPVSATAPVPIGAGAVDYGLEDFEFSPEEAGGGQTTQAGSHPFQLSTTVAFNKTERLPMINLAGEGAPVEPALPKDVNVKLPPGLVGNPTPLPKCSESQFTGAGAEFVVNASDIGLCADDTVVGEAVVVIDEPNLFGVRTFNSPIFSLVPEKGEPARFGFVAQNVPVYLDTSVRAGGDYGVNVNVNNISQIAGVLETEVTFWGVPDDTHHDNQRGWYCGFQSAYASGAHPCKPLQEAHPQPFLIMPTSCTGPLQITAETDSWKERNHFLSYGPSVPAAALDGCNRLGFEPRISVTPDSQAGSTASGLSVDLHVPQDESLVPSGLSEANVKDTTVTLPEGLVLNPSAADGLQSCSLGQIGLESSLASSCPDAAKVGAVTIHTPLLPDPLTGAAYLAAQNANPFGSLVALYVVAEDAKAGVLVKLAGEVHLTDTGQIISTFKNTPQLPFEDFELHFFGGDRAPLATPAACGAYTTQASLSPWSGSPAVDPSSTFLVTSGPDDTSCSSQLGFSPSLTGGSTNIQAGGLSPFTTTMSRNDGEQPIGSVELTMPDGLMGSLTGVPLCEEAQANAGTCGSGSLIGHTIVSVGIGGDPFSVTGGRVYITGPYQGAPFGLSIVEPAAAGPFDLGTVVVRAKIEVDPRTAQLTVTTDPSGPHAIPQILDGIPLQIRHVNVTVNREGFTFNPTSCERMAIGGAIGSSQGAGKQLSVPFQVANCARLSFKPLFQVTTSGKTSRVNGASLHVRLAYPKAPFGSQANIAKVKVDLPRQMPSRLSTLQKACSAATFESNPASCPAGSRVGAATATTPVIPVALTGPAYFVSYGGAKFPELVIVLSGYGVTVDLHGETFISKAGITSSTFRQVPDVPIGTFELTLPQGPGSALAASANLCAAKLVMPTVFTAQNGALIRQSTPISVTGCAKHKGGKAKRARSARRARDHAKKK